MDAVTLQSDNIELLNADSLLTNRRRARSRTSSNASPALPEAPDDRLIGRALRQFAGGGAHPASPLPTPPETFPPACDRNTCRSPAHRRDSGVSTRGD